MLTNRLKTFLLLMAGLFIVLPYFWACQYIFPASDDWGDYLFYTQHGTLGAVKEIYQGWSGRYFSTFLVYMLHPADDMSWIKIRVLCILSILMFLVGIYLIARVLEKKLQLQNNIWLLIMWLVVLLMGSLPSTSEFFFWFTGAYAYIPGFLLISLWFYAFYVVENFGIKYRILWLCSLLIPGTNEFYIITAAIAFAFILLLEYKKNASNFNMQLLFALLLFLIGSSIAIFSPGSQVRQDFIQAEFSKNMHNVTLTLETTLHYSWFYLRDWLRSSPILWSIIGIAFLIPNEKYASLVSSKNLRIGFFFIPISIFVILFAPYVWLTGFPVPPERVLNIIFLWFCFAIISIGIILIKKLIPSIQYNPNYSFIIFSIVFIHSTYSSNSRFLLNDMPSIKNYASQMQARIDLVKHSQGQDVSIEALKNRPKTFVFSDLDENPNHWYNKDFSRVFQLKSIQVTPLTQTNNDNNNIRNNRE